MNLSKQKDHSVECIFRVLDIEPKHLDQLIAEIPELSAPEVRRTLFYLEATKHIKRVSDMTFVRIVGGRHQYVPSTR